MTGEIMTGGRLSLLLLTTGLVLSVATQLRVPGLPIGPGESLLVGWFGLALFAALLGAPLQVPRYGLPFLLFWALSFAVLSADLVIWNIFGPRVTYSSHAFVAYAFICLLLMAYLIHDSPERQRQVLSSFVVLSAVSLSALLCLATFTHRLGPIEPWYASRFCGWAENPNQIAFHVAALPFLAISLFREASDYRQKVLYSGSGAGAVAVGVATFTDALLVAWLVGAVLFFVLDYWFGNRRTERGYWSAVFRYLLVPTASVMLLAMFSVQMYKQVEAKAIAIYDDGNQGSARMALWHHGLEAMAKSPLIGLGPGAHSGVAAPFSGAEAHNSLIDWGSSTGLVGLVAYVLLAGWLFSGLWRGGDAALVVAFVSLFIVSLFHYTFRHPVFWFVLVFLAGRTAYRSAPLHARGVSRGWHVRSGRVL